MCLIPFHWHYHAIHSSSYLVGVKPRLRSAMHSREMKLHLRCDGHVQVGAKTQLYKRCLSRTGHCRRQFDSYRWRPCGVNWDSVSQTVAVLKLLRIWVPGHAIISQSGPTKNNSFDVFLTILGPPFLVLLIFGPLLGPQVMSGFSYDPSLVTTNSIDGACPGSGMDFPQNKCFGTH